jgi:heme A synthase
MLFQRLAWIAAALTFVLLLLGGIVHMTDSGLACPTWPMCFPDQTSLIPNFGGKPLIEYSHRLTAKIVGVMTMLLLAVAFRTRREQPVRFRLSLLAFVLVLFQGLLGKITVEHSLPTLVSTGHLATAMLFFALIVSLALGAFTVDDRVPVTARTRTAARLSLVAIYLQIVLGAFVRHTGSGLACGTSAVLCADALWPPSGPAQLHMVHRFMALVVTGLVFWSVIRLRRETAGKVRRVALCAAVLVVVQVGLGVLSVATALQLHSVTTHQGVGAILFACYVALAYFTRRQSRSPQAATTVQTNSTASAVDMNEARALS